jgi:hypothetical protein
MKNKKSSHDHDQRPASASRPTAAAGLKQNGIDFAPLADEVAKRAYFTYLNEGSIPGRDEKYWLEAEAQLRGEVSRVHALHN